MSVTPFKPLELIGNIDVPAAALKHYNMAEAHAVSQVFKEHEPVERVIGTYNTGAPKCQLYGWAKNVATHTDNTGIVYFTPLIVRRSLVGAMAVGKATVLRIKKGEVYRLNDRYPHWTLDSSSVVCAFAGVFPFMNDDRAMAMLQAGIADLAAGKYSAPRVRDGFRARQDIECWADVDDVPTMMPIELAKAEKRIILRCAKCNKLADRPDNFWPYHGENNRCRVCMKSESATASPPR